MKLKKQFSLTAPALKGVFMVTMRRSKKFLSFIISEYEIAKAIFYIFIGMVLLHDPLMQAQDVTIASLARNGSLSWTNSHPQGSYTVEWASSLTQLNWTNTWSSLDRIVSTASNVTVMVPMFYRVKTTDPRQFAFADYCPQDPNVLGNMTFRSITKQTNYYYTNAVLDMIVVPYTAGKIWGVRIGDSEGDADNGMYIYNNGISVRYLGHNGWFASTDANLTDLPKSCHYSTVYEGWTQDSTYARVKTDLSASKPPEPAGTLIKINTITVPRGTFTNAIAIWSTDSAYPYTKLKFFDSDVQFGLTLPTSVEAGGSSITHLVVYGRGTGRILECDIDAALGTLVQTDELMAISHQ